MRFRALLRNNRVVAGRKEPNCYHVHLIPQLRMIHVTSAHPFVPASAISSTSVIISSLHELLTTWLSGASKTMRPPWLSGASKTMRPPLLSGAYKTMRPPLLSGASKPMRPLWLPGASKTMRPP